MHRWGSKQAAAGSSILERELEKRDALREREEGRREV
jgi:hypothetical protein